MSGAWWFVIGWLSASSFIAGGILLQRYRHARRARRAWLNAHDSELFANGCQQFTEAQGI